MIVSYTTVRLKNLLTNCGLAVTQCLGNLNAVSWGFMGLPLFLRGDHSEKVSRLGTQDRIGLMKFQTD